MATNQLANRVMELEILVTHLQRELAELNQVATDQQRQIDALSRQLNRLGGTSEADSAQEDAAEGATDGSFAAGDPEVEDWNE